MNVGELVAELRADLAEPDVSTRPTREELTILLGYIARLEADLATTRAKLTAALDTVQPVVVGRGEA